MSHSVLQYHYSSRDKVSQFVQWAQRIDSIIHCIGEGIMQHPQISVTTNSTSHLTQDAPKKLWNRPTLVFISLQATANSIGSGTDAGTVSTSVGCLEISAPLC